MATKKQAHLFSFDMKIDPKHAEKVKRNRSENKKVYELKRKSLKKTWPQEFSGLVYK